MAADASGDAAVAFCGRAFFLRGASGGLCLRGPVFVGGGDLVLEGGYAQSLSVLE